MHTSIAAFGLVFVAGALSTLSPCVLPIVPILIGSAMNAHRRAPLMLAAGLAISYAVIGTALAWAGNMLTFDPDIVRKLGAGLLGIFAVLLLFGSLQERFAVATSGISNAGNQLLARTRLEGLPGQFIVGLVLGAVWSPCVGPTLGAAIVLASEGHSLVRSALLMALFAIGATAPILLLASLSRTTMMKVRGKMLKTGRVGKVALGVAMLAIAVFTFTGQDRLLEAWLVNHSPTWLTALTTQF